MQLKRQHTCCQNADPHRWPTQSYCGVTLLKKAENTPTNVDSKRVAASRLDAMVHLVATRAPIAPARLAGSSASLELMCVGNVVGLLLTNAGLILMRSGQPVLLYLVPSKFGVLVVAKWLTNGLLRKLWDRPTEFNQLQRWSSPGDCHDGQCRMRFPWWRTSKPISFSVPLPDCPKDDSLQPAAGSQPPPPPPSPSKSFELKMQAYRAYSGRDFAQYIKLCSCALEALDKELESGSRRPYLQAEKGILLMHRASSLTLVGKVHEALQDGIAAVELNRKNLRADDAKEAYQQMDLILRGLNPRQYPRLDDYRAQLHEGLLAVESLESLLREINRCTVANDNKGALRATEDAIAIALNSFELRMQNESDKAEDCRRRLDQKGASGGVTSVGIKMSVLYCRALHYHNKTEQAFEVLEQLLRVAPTNVDLLHVKRLWELMEDVSLAAYEAFNRGDCNKAVLLYTKALTLDKHHRTYNASVLGSRATAYMALAQYDKAVQDCNAALKYRPVYFKVLLRRARCYDIMNLYKESVADYDEYMAKAKVTPDDLRHVPKTAQDGELFKYMSAAYGVLSDKQLKAAYDMELRYRGH
ncbi:hypothetical protein DYB30_006926 [Aphanomyces astaci]|uniref:Uncharacterized protein n=1 Tax=Aphanomyces astaci TaxID=112090 RepID=A0A397D123_APHAT|nr:hypothetical protein DYB30_006926 [Aphanomyces astaci]